MSISHLSVRFYFLGRALWIPSLPGSQPVYIARVDNLWKPFSLFDGVKVMWQERNDNDDNEKKNRNIFLPSEKKKNMREIRNSIYLCKRFNLTKTIQHHARTFSSTNGCD